MKQTFLISLLSVSLFFSNHSRAQVPVASKVLPKVMLGLKAGANFQQTDGKYVDNGYKLGIVGGAFASLSKGNWGVQAEGLIKTVKFSMANGASGYVKSVYFDIPVLLEYKLIPRVWIQAGPQFSILGSAKDNSSNDVKTSFNTSNLSGVVGLQAILPMHWVVGARYIYGLTDINSSSAAGGSVKNRSAQLYVGFRFL